jgi:hypothetical protein
MRACVRRVSRKTFTRELDAKRTLGGRGGTSWFAAPSEGEGRKDWLKLINDGKMRCLACIRYRVGDPNNSFALWQDVMRFQHLV